MPTVSKNGASWTYTLSDGSATITAFNNNQGLASIVIPNTLDGYNVVTIATNAMWRFSGGISSVTSVSFESTSYVTSIGDSFLDGFSFLTSASIPSSVVTIGANFLDNTRVTSFTFPSSVTTVGARCFRRSDVNDIVIPSSVTSLADDFGLNANISSKQVTINTPILSAWIYNEVDLRTIYLNSPTGGALTSLSGAAFEKLQKTNPGTFYTTSAIATQLTNARAANPNNPPSNWTITTLSAPSAPDKPTVVSGDKQVTVSWAAPANGGSTITGYTVTSTPGSFTASVSGSTLSGTVTGLSNGVSYTFKVTATNAFGTSAESPASNSVKPIAGTSSISVSETLLSISSYIEAQAVSTYANKKALILNFRASFKDGSFANNTEKADKRKTFIDTTRAAIGSSLTIQTADFNSFTNTLSSFNNSATPLPIDVILPNYVSQAATVDVSSMTTSSYLHAEIPVGYTATLSNGATSLALTFNGTNFTAGQTTIASGDNIVLGDKTFKVIGVGSIMLQLSGSGGNVVCMTEDTLIKTPNGDVSIQSLHEGDLVTTGDNRIAPIIKMEKIVVASCASNNVPYVIEKDAFGPSQPPMPMRVSPRHAIQIKPDLWELPREAAKVNKKIHVDLSALNNLVVYHHFALPDYSKDTIVANGQITECLNDGAYVESYEWNAAENGYVRKLREQ